MADSIPLSEMPTLSLLYKLNRITPSSDSKPSYKPSATYNDKISVIRQDITLLAVDAIVNAANNSLLGGGGVDGAIHRAAGPDLLAECETLDGCDTGSAKITDGYELPAKKVIHAVGPIYWAGKEQAPELLAGCYRTSLELAVEFGLKSVAFSALSTGVYGYPSGEASEVALETVRKFFEQAEGANTLDRVVFCNFLQKDEDAYFKNISKYFPPVEPESEKTDQTGKGKSTDASQLPDAPSTNETELASQLPDAPTAEPSSPTDSEQPSTKKQKTESTAEDDDFVVVDKEEAKDGAETPVVVDKDEAKGTTQAAIAS